MDKDDLEFGPKSRSAKRGRRPQNKENLLEEEKTFNLDKMEDPDDLETDIAPTTHTPSAKKGRRARNQPAAAISEVANGSEMNDIRPRPTGDDMPKPSKRGGWGEDAPTRSATSRRRGDDIEDERLRPRSPAHSDEGSDNEIPVIPDLDEYQEEDMTQQVAQAPTVAVNRVATFRELDNDLLRHAAFLTLDNEIDLKLLAKWLSAESEVIEEDRQWDWDRLFTEVASDLTTEWEKSQQAEQTEAST